MIDVTVQLICDGCETAYPADPRVTGSAVAIRVAAARQGWKTTGRGRSFKDVCPRCCPSCVSPTCGSAAAAGGADEVDEPRRR